VCIRPKDVASTKPNSIISGTPMSADVKMAATIQEGQRGGRSARSANNFASSDPSRSPIRSSSASAALPRRACFADPQKYRAIHRQGSLRIEATAPLGARRSASSAAPKIIRRGGAQHDNKSCVMIRSGASSSKACASDRVETFASGDIFADEAGRSPTGARVFGNTRLNDHFVLLRALRRKNHIRD